MTGSPLDPLQHMLNISAAIALGGAALVTLFAKFLHGPLERRSLAFSGATSQW